MTAPELRPCPFCGRDNIQYCGGVYSCVDCGAEAPYNLKGDDAASIWNTRADLSRKPTRCAECDCDNPPKLTPTDDQIANACLSYRHDFGLLEVAEQSKVKYAGLEWLLAWQKAMPQMGNTDAPAALEEIKRQVWNEALEAAALTAAKEGVYKELNVYGGGPEWYRHGKRITAAIRAMKTEKP
jgi:hypothetical protein